MATTLVFFEVEFWDDAQGPGFVERYRKSLEAFFKAFKDYNTSHPTLTLQQSALEVIKSRVDLHIGGVPVREVKAFRFDDGDAATDAQGSLEVRPPLGLPEIGFPKNTASSTATPAQMQLYPALVAWRSSIHRFWGTVFFDGDLPDTDASHETKCLLRAIFYPCLDHDTSSDRCTDYDSVTTEQMTDPNGDGVIEYDGTFVLGIFRWQAWRLKDNIGVDGNPMGQLVGNGAGGGDHRFS